MDLTRIAALPSGPGLGSALRLEEEPPAKVEDGPALTEQATKVRAEHRAALQQVDDEKAARDGDQGAQARLMSCYTGAEFRQAADRMLYGSCTCKAPWLDGLHFANGRPCQAISEEPGEHTHVLPQPGELLTDDQVRAALALRKLTPEEAIERLDSAFPNAEDRVRAQRMVGITREFHLRKWVWEPLPAWLSRPWRDVKP